MKNLVLGVNNAMDSPSRPFLTIRARKSWEGISLKELWQYRDLMLSLAARDLRLRYKQTLLGVIWVVLQPLMSALIFSFVFGSVAKLGSGGIPYFAFSYAGLLGWTVFSGIISKVSGCLIGNAHLISKVYFPRLILPFSNVGSVLVDFAVAGGLLVLILFHYRIAPGVGLILLPIWMGFLILSGLGIGLICAALSVSYRDVQYVLPVLLQILLYASPVAYSVNAVPEHLRWVYSFNPLTPALEAMRSSVLGGAFPKSGGIVISGLMAGALFFMGLQSFRQMEKKFADVI